MAYCIKSLKEELEQAKSELQKLKAREYQKQPLDPDIEDLKFIENPTRLEIRAQDEEESGYQRRRSVKFASPPSLARVIVNKDEFPDSKSPSFKKTKRKPLPPILGWLFSKKKGMQGSESPTVEALC